MFLLNSVSKEEAIKIFAEYCSKNSTPEDIFDFDGDLPRARLKYCPIVAYYAKYAYEALVEIRTESEYHTTSSLGSNSSQYRYNKQNPSGGFFASMYEDYSDTRYSDTTVKQVFMDKATGIDSFVAFGSTGQGDTVDEKFWPSENMDASLLIDDIDDFQIRKDVLLSQAVDLCVENTDIDNAEPPYEKMDYIIRRDINNALRNKYSKCNFEIKNVDYDLIEDSQTINLIYFPYYEFSFTYNRIPYFVNIAAHTQAEESTGFFGGPKDVIDGNLPTFVKMPGSIFSKINDRKKRKARKREDKDVFLNITSKNINFTA